MTNELETILTELEQTANRLDITEHVMIMLREWEDRGLVDHISINSNLVGGCAVLVTERKHVDTAEDYLKRVHEHVQVNSIIAELRRYAGELCIAVSVTKETSKRGPYVAVTLAATGEGRTWAPDNEGSTSFAGIKNWLDIAERPIRRGEAPSLSELERARKAN